MPAEHNKPVGCANCSSLEERVAVLEAKLAAAQKTSANSSKPPSSDLVKSPAARKQPGKRKRGAQPGHAKHERVPFTPAEITEVQEHILTCCPDCGGKVTPIGEPASRLQQVKIVAQPVQVVEHRSRVCRCAKCDREFVAPIPPAVKAAGLVGPQLTALIWALVRQKWIRCFVDNHG